EASMRVIALYVAVDPSGIAVESAPFSGKDIDADFAATVAKDALEMGQEQVTSAEAKAAEAVKAADDAEAAAKRATAEVAPAFKAAADAARSSANAARSTAAAMKSAAQAAEDGAKARAAAARANQADAQAQADAKLARQSANQAYSDAAAARQAANQAEAEAARARGAAAEADQHASAASSAANLAEKEAAVAQGAATQAEEDATAAGKLAESAEQHAKSAEEASKNANTYAEEADKAAQKAEEYQREQERKERQEAAKEKEKGDGSPLDLEDGERKALEAAGLTVEEFEAARALDGKSLIDYLMENGAELLVELFFEDIKACIDDPDIPTCLWAIIQNIGPGKAVKIGSKFPKISKAIWGIGEFLEKSAKAKKLINKGDEILEKAWKKLPACVTGKKKSSPVALRSTFSANGLYRPAVMRGGGSAAGDLGLAREDFIAKLIGGKVAKDAKGQDIKIVMPNVGSSGLDVIGPNGEYVYVGGGAKAHKPSKFGTALKINKYAADQAGVKAIYYLADNTPQAAIDQAKKVFGEENVHIFTLPSC
ncbi:hypothetical protein ABZ726_23860, partial [Streptomyces hundungensis]